MANELEQRARELLRSVYVNRGEWAVGNAALNGHLSVHDDETVMSVIIAALQQAQQQSRGAARRKVGTASDSPTNLDTPPQQPGAPAVAPILWVHPMLLEGTPLAVECSPMRLARAQIPLYTAPPPLPEGVSEEDVRGIEPYYALVLRQALDALTPFIDMLPDGTALLNTTPTQQQLWKLHAAHSRLSDAAPKAERAARLATRGENGVQS